MYVFKHLKKQMLVLAVLRLAFTAKVMATTYTDQRYG